MGATGLLAWAGPADGLGAEEDPKGEEKEEEIAPTEDLMRKHGVLKRVLLLYDEINRRLDAREDFSPQALSDAVEIIRRFIEDYHEKLEQDFLFPRFEKAGKYADLTRTLREQHQAGRRLTDLTLRLANGRSLKDASDRLRLGTSLRQFRRMYEPHEAREDTVLFPALRKVVSQHEFGALGEEFERREHQLFGKEGFEAMVDKVAGVEKALGIYELSQFTPNV